MQRCKTLIENTPSNKGVGTMFNPTIFISDLYKGSEHDIDIIMSDVKCIFYVLSDNVCHSNTEQSNFTEKGCIMPSRRFYGKKNSFYNREIIKSFVENCLIKLKLVNGVYNVEFIMTGLGMKIIDINPRPGGYYINEWIRKLYGIDTFKYEILSNSNLIISKIHNLCLNKTEIIGESIFDTKHLASRNYDFIFQLNEDLISDGIDPIAMIYQIKTVDEH